MKRQKKISRCPFCGGEAEIHVSYEDPDSCNVRCPECYARTGWYHSEEQAIAAWNMRPEHDV